MFVGHRPAFWTVDESLHQITTESARETGDLPLSHKESLHQITTADIRTTETDYCHTKNHCIKSQQSCTVPPFASTVTQRIIASNHNTRGAASCRSPYCHTKNHCIKSQRHTDAEVRAVDCHTKNHCIKSQPAVRPAPAHLHCHTKNHCIKSQPANLQDPAPWNCHTKNHCIKSQQNGEPQIGDTTVTQRIIASNHNSRSLTRE